MKKVTLFAFAAFSTFAFTSCLTGEDGILSDSKHCWKFSTTTKCTGVESSTVTIESCNLTEEEAENARKSLESSASAGGVTCTTTATKTKTD
jgi:hypothetical protein